MEEAGLQGHKAGQTIDVLEREPRHGNYDTEDPSLRSHDCGKPLP